ncbi:MAG: PaaI family thioesterase [Pseudomonadota bacterium]
MTSPGERSLQDRYAPKNICFGCGPANDRGLRIKSFVRGEETVAVFRPESHHHAFPGMLSGGIIGTLLDCHSNWTAAYHLMKKAGADIPPCTVTSEFTVKLLRPTPADGEVSLRARAIEVGERKAVIEAELWAAGDLCATCRGVFVSVKEGHPAFNRW